MLSLRLALALEWAARTSPRPPPRAPAALRPSPRLLARQHEGAVWYYGEACLAERGRGRGGAPPVCDGYLMYRHHPRHPWRPAYFLLRSGVLEWAEGRVETGDVVGSRRLSAESAGRPHCVELALPGGRRLQLAAPDDPTASRWLHALLQHAPNGGKQEEEGVPPGVSVLVRGADVLVLRESDWRTETRERDSRVLRRDSVLHLAALRVPPNDDNWCTLEWEVCEASEDADELTLVFASSAELDTFIAAMEKAYCAHTALPLPLFVSESSECAGAAAHARYQLAWARVLPAS